MTKRGWKFVNFKDGWKPHAVPNVLHEKLLADLASRGAVVASEKTSTRFSLDYGGMAVLDRPWSTFKVAGLGVSFPSEHVESFARRLKALPLRQFADGSGYVKLHSHWNALVLTPQQRDVLVRLMEAAGPAAAVEADRFYETWKAGLKPSKPPLDDAEVAEAEKIAVSAPVA